MGAPKSRLTRLQTGILEAFFRRESRFYLSGGGALAGYHLGHRETHDLDLFTLSPTLEEGVRALRQTATELGLSWGDVVTAPEFRRVLLSGADESVIVDLVVERAEQVKADKPMYGLVRVDPPEEIFANKLCTLLGRSEVRDLIDLRALEGLGLPLAEGLEAGRRKDGGLTPAPARLGAVGDQDRRGSPPPRGSRPVRVARLPSRPHRPVGASGSSLGFDRL